MCLLFFVLYLLTCPLGAAIQPSSISNPKPPSIRKFRRFKRDLHSSKIYRSPVFDFPMIYNDKVKAWVQYFQTDGRKAFRQWLERSARYAPYIKTELKKHNLPKDLLYVAMIESGFAPKAKSIKGAVGIWQFIAPTARRYGLKVNWWVDERRNFTKATRAAIAYKKNLYQMFRSWYLVFASYNSGENRIQRLIKQHKTNNFWKLCEMGLLPEETINYVPKIIAAALIAKAPALYGFKDLNYRAPYQFEEISVPGGMNLGDLARYIGVREHYLRNLNPELLRGFIPREIKSGYRIKIPLGSKSMVQKYSRLIAQST